jgi:ATP-binding cassette subfamily B protein
MAICGILAVVMEKKLDQVYDGISEENAVLTTVAQENLAGVRTVKAFAREKHEIQKYLSHNNRYYELNITQSKILASYHPIFQLVGKLLPIASTILGGFLVMKGEVTLGGLVAFVEYSRNCTWPMEMMGWLTNAVSAAFASHKKLKAIYEEKPEITNKEDAVILEEVKGEIRFEQVGFTIDKKEVLKEISFLVKPGNTLGIMGATGSGKSSVINLLQRFYEVTEGRILLEGVDIRDLTLKQLRSNIAVVS